jgi:hypothetical protein
MKFETIFQSIFLLCKMNGLNRSKKLLPQSIPSSPSRTDVHFHHLTAAISLLLLLLSATTQIVEPILFRNSGKPETNKFLQNLGDFFEIFTKFKRFFRNLGTQVKCFCDKGHCPGALTCTGKWFVSILVIDFLIFSKQIN